MADPDALRGPRGSIFLTATVALFVCLCPVGGTGVAAQSEKAAGCDVTEPQRMPNVVGFGESHYIAAEGLFLNAGRKATFAGLASEDDAAPRGTYPLQIMRDGTLKGKVPWFRDSRAFGDLEVTGVRHPGGDTMRGRYDNHLGPETDVVPGAMAFRRQGCWDITATSGDATLEATVRVVKVR